MDELGKRGRDTRGRREKRFAHQQQEANDPRADLKAAGFIEMCADVDLTYGGTFIRPVSYSIADDRWPDYFDVIEITDLDGACGASGITMVELKTVSVNFTDPGDRRNYLSALECHGLSKRDIADIAKQQNGKRKAQCEIAYLLQSYGSNTDTRQTWLAVTDPDAAHTSREAQSWIRRSRQTQSFETVIPDHGKAALSLAINAAISAA